MFVIEPQFVHASDFAGNGLASVMVRPDGLVREGYINENGEFVIEPKFALAGDFIRVS